MTGKGEKRSKFRIYLVINMRKQLGKGLVTVLCPQMFVY